MADIFLKIFNMSISACWIILAVTLLRTVLKKAPKWINCVLWASAGLRLIMPFSFESIFSLLPSAEFVPQEMIHSHSSVDVSGAEILNYVGNNPVWYDLGISNGRLVFTEIAAPDSGFVNPLLIITYISSIVWGVGIVALLIYSLVSFIMLKRKIGTAVLLRDNIYQSEAVVSPFVLGIIKPKIYLPFNINAQDMEHVVAHERAHLHRKDHWWKPLGFLILTLHWFNPLVWLGYVLLCRDIELACDEKVVKELNNEQRADYSQALLTCSVNRRMIAACPLAFGESGVKNRVKSVLNYKKPAFWIIAVAVIASIVVAICFLTNPQKSDVSGVESQRNGSDLSGVSLEIVSADLSAPDPFLEIEWINNTPNQILFGEEFAVLYSDNGKWENCSIDKNPVWNAIGYLLEPESTTKRIYKLNGQNMSQPGTYRFIISFNVEGQSEPEDKAWVDFELKESVEGITVHIFEPVELVYDDAMYSYVQTAENAPTYMIVNSMQLLENFDGKVSEPLGTFEEITLNKDNFDSRFRSAAEVSWLSDDTLRSLKNKNKRAWQLYADSTEETPYLYILLEQKDSTFYLGRGYYNGNSENPANPDDSHIRWLYKLSESVGNSEGNISTQLTKYTDDEIINEPPTLTVICNERSIEAIKGTSSWMYEGEDGISQGIMSDSNHPLMLKGHLPVLEMLPTHLGHIDPTQARLQFNANGIEVTPDEIRISYWKEKHWGNTDAESEEVAFQVINSNIFFELKDENCIYEIVAVWNSNEKFSGTVRYSFCTVKPD